MKNRQGNICILALNQIDMAKAAERFVRGCGTDGGIESARYAP